jgi:hypothetical protein
MVPRDLIHLYSNLLVRDIRMQFIPLYSNHGFIHQGPRLCEDSLTHDRIFWTIAYAGLAVNHLLGSLTANG